MAKAATEQMVNFEDLERIISNYKKDSESRHSLGYFEVRIERIRAQWAKCEAQHQATHAQVAHNSQLLSDYLKEYDRFEQLYLEFYAEFKDKALTFRMASAPLQAPPTPQINPLTNHEMIRLESIKIPKFEGNYLKWTTFNELFVALVHDNRQLRTVQKMQYLMTSLGGEAKRLIENLSVTEANYEKAWTLIKNRYSNKRTIISMHLQAFLNLPTMKMESVDGYKRIMDTTNEMKTAVGGLGVDTEAWYPIIVHIASHKLDREARKNWEYECGSKPDVPTWTQFCEFLSTKFRSLEVMSDEIPRKKQTSEVHVSVETSKCAVCKGDHKVYKCAKFQRASVDQRRELVRTLNLCFNCFDKHRVYECPSKSSCKLCAKKHNTMLHVVQADNEKKMENLKTQSTVVNHKNMWNVLLATAIVRVRDVHGQYITLRALLDQGSQNSFITADAAKLLGYNREHAKVLVSGIGKSLNKCHGKIPLIIKEKWSDKVIQTTALVMGKITNCLPSSSISGMINLKVDLEDLADPNFTTSSKVDLLIGADIYGSIIMKGLLKGYPTAQKTRLGWILSGPISHSTNAGKSISMVSIAEVDQVLRQFWKQEEVPQPKVLKREEEEAEEHYRKTTTRLENGKFQVRLPAKGDIRTQLAASCRPAIAKYTSNEKRLLANEKLYAEYNRCLQEYLDLGHMEEVPKHQINNIAYYMPHHAVVKETSSTTKVRVVFNASAKTDSGKSLNDLLMVGPTIQDTLIFLLLRWRLHPVVITADIEKMYRQIQVHEKDTDWQRIVWRPHKADIIRHYRLKTVTFGTASAPFQAIRTLQQLAEYEKDRFPKAVEYLKRDFYVDDLLTGADTVEEAVLIYNQLTQLLGMGGFNLRKWNSNCSEVLNEIPSDHKDSNSSVNMNLEETIKMLGIQWHPHQDEFRFNISTPKITNQSITKRLVASHVESIFDPLGWLQPIIITGKVFLQKLWLHKIGWDDQLPEELQGEWKSFENSLAHLKDLKLPRWLGTSSKDEFELHGFCDASRQAIAAAIYIRITKTGQESPIVRLLTSKTKVTPLAVQTIPRLELNSAALLVKLMEQTKAAFTNGSSITTFYWTDSSVVLSWLSDHPSRWNTYVANRVSEIHAASTISQWHHVPTKCNPADCATRGLPPAQLEKFDLWWNGPDFIRSPNITFPRIPNQPDFNLEKRSQVCAAITEDQPIITSFSSYTRMVRVVAYCRRLLPARITGRKVTDRFLTSQELHEARQACIKMAQELSFGEEIKCLTKGKPINGKSHILQLNPFLDTSGVLRVGGRLQNAALKMNEKHPIILSHECQLAKLVIRHIHHKTLHGPVQLTLSTVRKEFWILNAQRLVKACIHKCITCFKSNAQPGKQLMGNLPECRATLNRPFWSTGLDFAGPIKIKWSNGRGAKTAKAYIAVFVCLATKAMHLELVSDLTSNACIAAVKRFISRRGKCKNIYSDCGTNFVAAGKELQANFNSMASETRAWLANDDIVWHHIPPRSPHFGGLWEAGVKSVKQHLLKTIGESLLNIEEMYTLLAQIEACLNSRPLAPLSDDVNDMEPLTPAHFLIGDSMFAAPATVPDNINLLKRWQLTQKLAIDFWKRWHSEYLTRLQARPKWARQQENLEIGQLVLVKNEDTPPTKWPLARIINIHPGNDGLVRVVTIKLNGNITKRPIVKLCLLPTNESSEEYSRAALKRNVEQTNKPNETRQEQVTSKRRRIVTSSNLGMLSWPVMMLSLVAIFTTFPQVESVVNVTQLSGGIYAEHLGRASMNRGILQLNVNISRLELQNEEIQVINTFKNISEICSFKKIISNRLNCGVLIQHLEYLIEDIHHFNTSLHFLRRRARRGLLGSLLTSVFGVNDEAYHDIDQLSENQANIRKVVEQQGNIMLKASKALNETNDRVTRQLSAFNSHLNDCIKRMNEFNSLHHEGEQNKMHIMFLGVYEQAKNYLMEIRNKYDCLWRIATNKNDILSCSHVTDILRILNKTESSLPSSLRVHHRSNIPPQIEFLTESIIIHGFLPIVAIKSYDLIKATAIPHHLYNDSFVVHKIPDTILGVNFDTQEYFELTETMLQSSFRIDDESYIIKLRVLHNLQSPSNCLIHELYHNYGEVNCTSQIFSTQSIIWKQTHNLNTWLYTSPTSTPTHAICNGKRSTIILKDSGIVQLSADCSLSTMSVTLIAEQRGLSKSLPIYFKAFTGNISMPDSASLIPVLNGSIMLQATDSLSSLVQEAYEDQTKFKATVWKPIHRHAISISVSVVIICIIFVIIWLIYIYVVKCKSTKLNVRTKSKWHEPDPNQPTST